MSGLPQSPAFRGLRQDEKEDDLGLDGEGGSAARGPAPFPCFMCFRLRKSGPQHRLRKLVLCKGRYW